LIQENQKWGGALIKTLAKWLWEHRKLVGTIAIAVLAVVIERRLPAPPMEIFLGETDVNGPAGAGAGVDVEPEFLAKVTAVVVPGEPDPITAPIHSLGFTTKIPGACRMFHFVYSARDRRDPKAPRRVTIRPRVPPGSTCTVPLDISAAARRHFEISADAAVELRLASAPTDPLLDHLAVDEISGEARKTKGGPFSLVQTEVEADKQIAVAGEDLQLRALTVSDDVPDGQLRAVLVSTKVPAVKVEGSDVSWPHRLKTFMKIRDFFNKLLGHGS
jgi:hypothetical protein